MIHADYGRNSAGVLPCFLHEDDKINRTAYELLLGADASFFHQLFQTLKRFFSTVRVERADAAGMTSVPELQQLQGSAVPDFPDQNPPGGVAHTDFGKLPHTDACQLRC